MACIVIAIPTLVLLALGAGESTPGDSFGLGGYGGLSFVLASLAFGTVGALVAARVPENPIGWVFCLMGLTLGIGDLAYQYADYALFVSSSLPGGEVAAWLQNLGLPPSFGLLAIALLLFPDGRLPSRRWRPALWLALAGITLIVVGYALRPGPLDDPFQSVSNPLGVPGAFDLTDAASGFGWMFMGASVAFAAAALVVRLRRSTGYERQQLKWIALAASVTGVAVVADVLSFFASVEGVEQLRILLLGVGFSAFPVAAGMAILRYRLYDIDVVINRTLVYGRADGDARHSRTSAACSCFRLLLGSPDQRTPAWRLPFRRSLSRRCSGRPEPASRRWWTGASTGASTTPSRLWRRSRAVCAMRSISARSMPNCATWRCRPCNPAHVSLWLRR